MYQELRDVPSVDFAGKAAVEAVVNALRQKQVEGWRIFFHPDHPVVSVADHIAVYGGTSAEILKCMVWMGKQNGLCVTISSGEVTIDRGGKLKALSGDTSLEMATDEEMLTLLGRKRGGVDPFTLPSKVPAWIDERLVEKEWVVGSCGSSVVGLGIPPSEIVSKTGFPVVSVGRE